MLNTFLNFALTSLVLTDLWLVAYTKILPFLNSRYPQKVNEAFLWIQPSPEPFEIPVYLVLTILIVLVFLLTKKLLNRLEQISIHFKVLLTVFLSTIFFSYLGPYPEALQISPYLPRDNPSFYSFTLIGYFAFILIGILLVKLFKKNKILMSIFLVLLIAFVTFDARFPMTGHDYEHFLGPAWEVLQGRTVYTDVLSRYAFLTINILAFLHKKNLLSLFYLPLIVWLLYITQYFLIYYLIKKISRSFEFAFLGLSSIMTINYFSLAHLPSTVPQTGPLRWFPMILLAFILYKSKRIDSLFFITSLSILSLFIVDVGIAMILTFLATSTFQLISKQIGMLFYIKTVLKLLIIFILTLLIVNVAMMLFGYKFVDVSSIIYSFKKHAVLGLSLMPMQMKTHFWFVLLIYFATIIYIFRNNVITSNIKHLTSNNLLLFSANLSLFASVYFVGRSHPHNLFHISIFPILNAFLLFGLIFKKLPTSNLKLLIYFLLILVSIVYPAIQRRFTLTEMLATKYEGLKKGNLFKSGVEEIISQRYKEEVKLIKNSIPSKQALILSMDDTYLFLKTDKQSFLDANPIMGIDLPEDLNFALKSAVKICPSKIAVDCSFVNKCPAYSPFIGVSFNLNLLLNKLESECRIKYVPTICTNQLCIAEQSK